MKTLDDSHLNPGWFGKLAYHLLPFRRDVILQNIETAYGNILTPLKIKRLAQKFYEHLWLTIFENIRMGWMSREGMKKMLRVEGRENAMNASAQGKGVILMTCHIGNWEIGPIMCAEHFSEFKGRFHVLRRQIVNKTVERLLFGRYRTAGLNVLPKRNCLDRILEVLALGDAVVFIMDQHAKLRKDGIAVDFFGKKAGTFKSLAIIAGGSGAPVVPAYGYREKNGKHVMKFMKPLEWISDPDYDRELILNTRRYNEAIEKMIGEHPEQWMWMHRRWKIKDSDVQTLN